MNGRFRRMLEPGERILLRSTDGANVWHLSGVFLFLGAVAWLRTAWSFGAADPRFWTSILFLMAFAVLVMAVAWPWTRWKWVVTDSRTLKAYGLFSPDIGEMRHETVEDVLLADRKLLIHGRDYRWKFAVPPGFQRAGTLLDLFGERMGDPGQSAKPLRDMLEPGETVLWRYSPLITDLLPLLVLLAGPLAFLVGMTWPETFSYPYFSPNMIVIPYVWLMPTVVALWRLRGWRIVLTNRRLLRRRYNAPSRCDAVPLDDVDKAYWDDKALRLVVASPGRTARILCLPWTARRILATLERDDRGEALA